MQKSTLMRPKLEKESHFPKKVILLWGLGTPVVLVMAHLIASKYLSSKYYISRIKKSD